MTSQVLYSKKYPGVFIFIIGPNKKLYLFNIQIYLLGIKVNFMVFIPFENCRGSNTSRFFLETSGFDFSWGLHEDSLTDSGKGKSSKQENKKKS